MVARRGGGACIDAMSKPDRNDLKQMTDRDLIAAYVMTDGDPDDPRAEALLAEIERRNLDI